MFVRRLMEIRSRIPKAKMEQTRFFFFFFAYLLDTHAEHMFFSALVQDSLIGNMLAWEGRAADRV